MTDHAPRFLFVPVSGPFGMGEYARSLAIAEGAAARWPNAEIRFVLSRAAPYATSSPYPVDLLDSSPTFHTGAVLEVLRRFAPDVVIFDNAGRRALLKAAQRGGARVVYISARGRSRFKAFRLRWMRVIDELWIAYPRFLAGGLSFFERVKLKFMRRPRVRYLDVILARRGGSAVLAGLGCEVDEYVLVVPGGGTGHPGAAAAVDVFYQAACNLATGGVDTVFVGPVSGPKIPRLRTPGALPQGELAELMRGARLIVANGGSTLLQSIACGRPCLAVPIAADQPERIRRCVAAGVAIAAPLDAAAVTHAATQLLADPHVRSELAGRAIALGLSDGVDIAVRSLAGLLR